MPSGASRAARRMSSRNQELPPSTIMSPGSSSAASCSIVASTEAAGTMTHRTRGAVRLAARSASEVAPSVMAPSATRPSTVAFVRA